MKKNDRGSESGASAVEYALLIAGIAAVLVVAVYALGSVAIETFTHTCTELDSAAQASASC